MYCSKEVLHLDQKYPGIILSFAESAPAELGKLHISVADTKLLLSPVGFWDVISFAPLLQHRETSAAGLNTRRAGTEFAEFAETATAVWDKSWPPLKEEVRAAVLAYCLQAYHAVVWFMEGDRNANIFVTRSVCRYLIQLTHPLVC